MTGLKNVRLIPNYWKYIPMLRVGLATTVYPYIYLPTHIYNGLVKEKPSTMAISILIHEKVHWIRQKNQGLIQWGIKYIFSKNFRLQEELAAITAQMKYLKKNHILYDTKTKAQQFSSSTYLWLLSYPNAKILLDKIWKDIR